MGDATEDRLKKMIVQRLFMKIAPEQIQSDQSLINAYGVDSVSLLELVVGIEEDFGITVGDGEFNVEHFETVKALADFVRGKLK